MSCHLSGSVTSHQRSLVTRSRGADNSYGGHSPPLVNYYYQEPFSWACFWLSAVYNIIILRVFSFSCDDPTAPSEEGAVISSAGNAATRVAALNLEYSPKK